jgi:hypothetical protein
MNMRMNFQTIAALAVLAAAPLEAGERLAMRLNLKQGFAPATVVVTATVERDAQNRELEIQIESTDFYRSSLVPLDGENAARTMTFQFRDLPGGQYEVRTIVRGSGERALAKAVQDIEILGEDK